MNQRIVLLETHDEIDKAIEVLKKTKLDRVIFVLPIKSEIFQSIINLRILRKNADENNKQIAIVSKNSKGRKMAENAGIHSFETIEEVDYISPKIKQKKAIKRKVIRLDEILENEDENKTINWSEVFSRPSKSALFTLLGISTALLFFVSMLVLPGATVYIKPEQKTIETVVNVIISENDIADTLVDKKQNIKGLKIDKVFESEIEFKTISRAFHGKHAEGEIIVKNAHSEERSLMPRTRFQSRKGIVYRIDDWITIPPLGEVIVHVKADEKDIYGDMVGEKGNIASGEKLILPGLPPDGQKIIWGEVKEIKGGTSIWNPVVRKIDFEKAKESLSEQMEEAVQINLEWYIASYNEEHNTNYSMVPKSRFLKTEVLDLKVDESVLDQEVESFKVSGKIRATSWALDENDLISILQKSLEKRVDSGMFLKNLDASSISIDVFDESERKDSLKISVNAKGTEAFLIEPKTESGIIFVDKVKNEILSKKISDAENILINFPEISDVKISVWPFFMRSVPHLPENISIKLWDENSDD